jgi:hypothetical protein
MIERLDFASIERLREALPRFAHLPLAHLHHLNPNQRRAYWLDEISQSLADESSMAFGSIVAGSLGGFVIYNDSPWDSQITGRRMGTLTQLAVAIDDAAGSEILCELLDELTRSLVKRGTQCVVCKVRPSELSAIHALEQRGFLLMDTLLELVFDFSCTALENIDRSRRDKRLRIRWAKPTDLAELMAINQRAFGDYFGRYHADPRMPSGAATRIYTEWLRSAFEGWADLIRVAEVNGKIAGYGLWRKPLKLEAKHSLHVARYDLGAVSAGFSGRRVWTPLILDGMDIARKFAQYALGPVHVGNYPVQRSLLKVGWKIAAARHSFHKWLTS